MAGASTTSSRADALGIRTLRYPALWETISPDDSERCDWRWHFLDGGWQRYPATFKGGNGVRDYADVEAVRVALPKADLGPEARLREVIARYGRPVAVTEVHHGCTREEQLRWLAETWDAAATLEAEGADVRAVTVWSPAGASRRTLALASERGWIMPPLDEAIARFAHDMRGRRATTSLMAAE